MFCKEKCKKFLDAVVECFRGYLVSHENLNAPSLMPDFIWVNLAWKVYILTWYPVLRL